MKIPPRVIRSPLYKQVADLLRAEVSRLKPGYQLESEKELAERFDVSVVTMREAVRLLVQEGLLDRRQGRQTIVADVSRQRHVAIVMETDFAHPRTSYFFRRVIQQLRRFFADQGVRSELYLGFSPPGVPQQGATDCGLGEDLRAHRVLAVAALATDSGLPWVRDARREGVPVAGSAPGFKFGVSFESGSIVRQGVDYLLKNGRRKIAFIGWIEPSERECFLSPFRETMSKAGLPVYPEWVRLDLNPVLDGAGWSAFREVWTGRGEKPDGLLCLDDYMMADATDAIVRTGIGVPQQLMVVTHSNKGSELRCPFPTIRLERDPDAYAQEFGRLLLNLVHKKPVLQPLIALPFVLQPEESQNAATGDATADLFRAPPSDAMSSPIPAHPASPTTPPCPPQSR